MLQASLGFDIVCQNNRELFRAGPACPMLWFTSGGFVDWPNIGVLRLVPCRVHASGRETKFSRDEWLALVVSASQEHTNTVILSKAAQICARTRPLPTIPYQANSAGTIEFC